EDVDAVRPSAHRLVDPAQLDVELVRGEGGGAEDAEAAGPADGGDHVAAVAEGEDGVLDVEQVADGGAHDPNGRRPPELQSVPDPGSTRRSGDGSPPSPLPSWSWDLVPVRFPTRAEGGSVAAAARRRATAGRGAAAGRRAAAGAVPGARRASAVVGAAGVGPAGVGPAGVGPAIAGAAAAGTRRCAARRSAGSLVGPGRRLGRRVPAVAVRVVLAVRVPDRPSAVGPAEALRVPGPVAVGAAGVVLVAPVAAVVRAVAVIAVGVAAAVVAAVVVTAVVAVVVAVVPAVVAVEVAVAPAVTVEVSVIVVAAVVVVPGRAPIAAVVGHVTAAVVGGAATRAVASSAVAAAAVAAADTVVIHGMDSRRLIRRLVFRHAPRRSGEPDDERRPGHDDPHLAHLCLRLARPQRGRRPPSKAGAYAALFPRKRGTTDLVVV